jgi:NEDD8-activating enzyme E1 regulatory subunit
MNPVVHQITRIGAMIVSSGISTTIIAQINQTHHPFVFDRLWAASGQTALESARILLTSATATSTSILKNLVLPGVGHFTILDPTITSASDAGNNFFLNGSDSIGKLRAVEAVPLLRELNDNVDGIADNRELATLLESVEGRDWIKSFSLIIAHNLELQTLDKLASLLWENETNPPLLVIRSAGLIADFYIQVHEHYGQSLFLLLP